MTDEFIFGLLSHQVSNSCTPVCELSGQLNQIVKSVPKALTLDIFKSMVVACQAAAVIVTLKHMSDRQLEYIGFTHAICVNKLKQVFWLD